MATKRKQIYALLIPLAVALGASKLSADDGDVPPPPGHDVEHDVMTRGPIHEAFATPTTPDPVEQPLVEQQPPEPIQEALPEHKPRGENVIWIPGYWSFEEDEGDFVWVSGLWRNVPPGRQWVPGYWSEVNKGYRWTSGAWVRAESNAALYPKPPESLERGASSPQPSDNHFYVPGSWVYRDSDYQWRPGYWAPHQRDWVWVPARYIPAGDRYLYSEGYWDYRLDQRGQLFAPIRFRSDAYTRSDFRFRPTGVVNSGIQLMMHLFTRPDRGRYVFGDYYESNATPWIDYARGDRGYDPLYNYYRWDRGNDFIERIRGWQNYFSENPQYRPRRTLAEQLTFVSENDGFKYLQQATLGNTLDQLLGNNQTNREFVSIGRDQLARLTDITNQVRNLTGQRLNLSLGGSANANANASANQSLRLPQLPGIDLPKIGRDVPDTPLNLRNAKPQLPGGRELPTKGLPTGDLPVDLPGLPF